MLIEQFTQRFQQKLNPFLPIDSGEEQDYIPMRDTRKAITEGRWPGSFRHSHRQRNDSCALHCDLTPNIKCFSRLRLRRKMQGGSSANHWKLDNL